MNRKPVISVIIPVNNRAQTIGRALRSVLKQTWQDLEVIIVDDGSTDATIEVIQTLKDPRIRMIRHDQVRGIAASWNNGLDNATGFYIAFLNPDDDWAPEKLDLQLAALRQAEPDIRICTTGYLYVQADGIEKPAQGAENDLRGKLLLVSAFDVGSTMLVEKTMFDEVGRLDEGLPLYQDLDWLIRYTFKTNYKTVEIPETLVKIFSPARIDPDKVENSILKILTAHCEHFEGLGADLKQRARASFLYRIALAYSSSGHNRGKERIYLWRTIRAYPAQPLLVYLEFIDSLLGTNLKTLTPGIKVL